MKNLFAYLFLAIVLTVAGCSESFDDSQILSRLDNHEARISKLEELCREMNTNISSLQTLVSALQNNDYVTSVTPITKDGETVGYTITFSKSQPITIYHGEDGEDGKDGQNGADGVDGKDGSTPIIGVKQDSDGIYYWTLNGEWLLDDNGNKIKAQGQDGQNGQDGADGADGKDGVTPQLKIENDYWYVSYDNGATWVKLGKATGETGMDGDSFFKSVTQDEHYVYFTLVDGSVITLPKDTLLDIVFESEDLQVISPNSTYEIGYEITSATDSVDIQAIPLEGIKVAVVSEDDSCKSGKLVITTKSEVAEGSGVVILVSNGDKFIMRSLEFEPTGIEICDGAHFNVPAEGGEVSLSFFTNTEYEVIIPDEASSWITLTTTRVLVEERISLTVARNEGNARTATITLQSVDGKVAANYVITQEGNTAQIYYTNGSTTEATTPYKPSAFGANILSNSYNAAKKCWVITFDGDVTSIGSSAFSGCSSLESITIPDSVTSIGYAAFYNCSSLTSITIPDSVTSIGNSAFYNCRSLTSVTIPDSVTSIGNWAFSDCSSLQSATIGNSVTSIGGGAFSYCSSLTSITIPDSVTSIGSSAFSGCSSLTAFYGKFTSADHRCLIIDGVLESFARGGLTSYTIPDSVTSIGEWAFYKCSSLTSVTIPDSVTSIGGYAFQECSSLTSIIIPDGVTSIGDWAFSYCSSLTSITIPDSVIWIGPSAFSHCSSLKEVYCNAVTPPYLVNSGFDNNATDRKIYVYDECVDAYKSAWSYYADYIVSNGSHIDTSNTTTITYTTSDGNVIDASKFATKSNTYSDGQGTLVVYGDWTSIPDYAFSGCYTLTSFTIPDSVTSIGGCAFYNCSSLKSVAIGDSVTSIGEGAFGDCSNLTNVTIGDSVTEIGILAFYNCSNLTAFYGKFASADNRCLIVEGVLNSFAPSGLTSYTIPDSVTTIGNYAFSGCTSLESITIPDSVTSIGDDAFRSCSSLESITIPDGVTSIGSYAFSYCSSLTSVTIGNSVTSIGGYAFQYCSSLTAFYGKFASEDNRCLIVDGVLKSFAPGGLTSYTIPDSVTSIGDDAFRSCSSLTSVTIGNSVTSIGTQAFGDCSSLTSIIIPDGVTSIGDWAFSYCSSLTSVTIGNSVTSIGGCAFYGCSSLESVTIPDSVQSIGSYAFSYCSSLTSVTIPDSVTSIGKYAFYNCRSLTSVVCYPTTPPTGGSDMFFYNASGRKIYVPTASVDAYKAKQYWSDYADYIEGKEF